MSNKHEEKFKAFVLMPFDKEFDAIFNNLIKPPLEEIGYDVKRADSDLNQENILKDIMRNLAGADLVLVDLTSLNANVLYELGISHAMQKSTILLTQSIEDVPFDLRSYRMILYSIHFSEAPKLSKELKEIGEGVKTGKIRFGNPVADFLPQMRQSTNYIMPKTVMKVAEKKVAEEEKGFLDFAVNGEKSMINITKCTVQMTKATLEIGEIMQRRTEQSKSIRLSRIPGVASKIYQLTKMIARDMIQYAERLKEEQPKLHKEWEFFAENTTGLIQIAKIRTKKEKGKVIMFRNSMEELKSANNGALGMIEEFLKSLKDLKGISRDVNRASDRIISVLDLIISDLVVAESYCTKIITLLDEKIE